MYCCKIQFFVHFADRRGRRSLQINCVFAKNYEFLLKFKIFHRRGGHRPSVLTNFFGKNHVFYLNFIFAHFADRRGRRSLQIICVFAKNYEFLLKIQIFSVFKNSFCSFVMRKLSTAFWIVLLCTQGASLLSVKNGSTASYCFASAVAKYHAIIIFT